METLRLLDITLSLVKRRVNLLIMALGLFEAWLARALWAISIAVIEILVFYSECKKAGIRQLSVRQILPLHAPAFQVFSGFFP